MPSGVVKWFDSDQGIGLISRQGGPDVQAEASAVHGSDNRLRQGEKVLFDIVLDSAGLRADNIHRLKGGRDGAAPAGSAEPSDGQAIGVARPDQAQRAALAQPRHRVGPVGADGVRARLGVIPGANIACSRRTPEDT
ncbi:cold-shock protein [Streptomyces sp. A1136]|nr:cold-shock protein [Streptomyces sp. A1136]